VHPWHFFGIFSIIYRMAQDDLRTLWAPWRIGYILGPRSGRCVFCDKAGAPREEDAENLVLERGTLCYVLMNAYPYNPGHLLVAPYAHVAAMEDTDRDALVEMLDLTVAWKRRLDTVVRAHGVNVGINLGSAAGAGITDHLHLHLVPRWQGDTNFMTTSAGTRVMSQALDELYCLLHTSLTKETA